MFDYKAVKPASDWVNPPAADALENLGEPWFDSCSSMQAFVGTSNTADPVQFLFDETSSETKELVPMTV